MRVEVENRVKVEVGASVGARAWGGLCRVTVMAPMVASRFFSASSISPSPSAEERGRWWWEGGGEAGRGGRGRGGVGSLRGGGRPRDGRWAGGWADWGWTGRTCSRHVHSDRVRAHVHLLVAPPLALGGGRRRRRRRRRLRHPRRHVAVPAAVAVLAGVLVARQAVRRARVAVVDAVPGGGWVRLRFRVGVRARVCVWVC